MSRANPPRKSTSHTHGQALDLVAPSDAKMLGDVDAPPGPLMGPYEIAERLGVSRQRFQQLSRYPTFPKPFQELRGIRVWLRAEIEDWIAKHRPQNIGDEDQP